ncbi:hypothetical protein AAC387_Pa09g2199 [Persea americana]
MLRKLHTLRLFSSVRIAELGCFCFAVWRISVHGFISTNLQVGAKRTRGESTATHSVVRMLIGCFNVIF